MRPKQELFNSLTVFVFSVRTKVVIHFYIPSVFRFYMNISLLLYDIKTSVRLVPANSNMTFEVF